MSYQEFIKGSVKRVSYSPRIVLDDETIRRIRENPWLLLAQSRADLHIMHLILFLRFLYEFLMAPL
jgi:hypothetical protein